MTVNHGTKVVVVRWEREGVVYGWTLAHDGPDGHELLEGAEQCECGVMAIGIIRE